MTVDTDALVALAERRAIARCIEIVREVRDGFLSEEYAVGQPLASFNERFACDQAAQAIENEFGIGTNEQRRLLGKPSMIEEYRADCAHALTGKHDETVRGGGVG